MQPKPQQPSSRHHFIPKFLLAQWAGPSGDLIQYYRDERGTIRSKYASPASVCYQRDLYKAEGFPTELAQQLETVFMSAVDDGAAKAHAALITNTVDDLTPALRCEWARFVMSIWFRTPQDVEGLKSVVESLGDPRAEGVLLDVPIPPNLPKIIQEQLRITMLRNLIDDEARGKRLMNMHWAVFQNAPGREFFVSDWPIDLPVSSPWMGASESYLAMPISPKLVFVAAESPNLINDIKALPPREMEARLNRAVVGHAGAFVGAASEKGLAFVKRTFGAEARPSLLTALAAKYKEAIGVKADVDLD